jgi:hypothetical protein
MQLTALYDNGRLIFEPMIQLRQNRLPIVVIIPDHEIMLASPSLANFTKASQPIEEQDTNLTQAQKLLGPEYHYVATPKTDRELLAEALIEKYL